MRPTASVALQGDGSFHADGVPGARSPQLCMKQDRMSAYEQVRGTGVGLQRVWLALTTTQHVAWCVAAENGLCSQFGMSLPDAMASEFDKGLVSLTEVSMIPRCWPTRNVTASAACVCVCVNSQAHKGAARFASGEGRHGAFNKQGEAGTGDDGTDAATSARQYDAVLFDLGGVIVNSPFVQVRTASQVTVAKAEVEWCPC